MLRRFGVLIALSLLGLVALAPSAWAHVEVEPEEAVAGGTETLSFSVEFEGAATTGLEVQLPDGASVTEVPAKAGWTASVDDAAHTVAWTGGSSSADETFTVVVQLPTTTGVVLFPAIQQTTEGEEAWIGEEETEGEEGNPAPRLTLIADPNATTTTEATTTTTAQSTTTTDALPGTTLEAEERDDGNTSAAPWIIGSAIVALLAIGIGGWLLKRRADREAAEAAAAADASGDGPGDGTPPAPGSGDGAGGNGSRGGSS
jgi:hypothetical protein